MIRKTLCIISLLIVALSSSIATATNWYKFPLFSNDIDDVIETSTKVYYLTGGNLFSFSPSDNESFSYDNLNVLHDNEITSIYYNRDKKYLLVVYKSSNIDIITDDGKIINLPEIKDSSVSGSKTINDVAFGEDRIAIATDFGFVLYDDNKFEVKESGIFNKALNAIGIMDGRLLIYGHYTTEFKLMHAPLEARHNSLDKFTPLFGLPIHTFRPITNDIMAIRVNQSNKLQLRKVNFKNSQYSQLLDQEHICDNPFKSDKEGYYILSGDKILSFDQDKVNVTEIPEPLKGNKIAYYDSPTCIWAANSDGVGCYDISSSTPTVLYDRMIYPNYITDIKVGYMRWSKDNNRLYISNMGNSVYRSYAKGEGSTDYQTTNIIEDGYVTDASLLNASATHSYSTKYQDAYKNKRMYGDPLWVIEDPDDPDKYYCVNYFEGLYVIKRNPQTDEYEEIGKFTSENAPITDNWGQRVSFVDIDPKGNLWVGHQFGNKFSILPADKRRQDPKNITIADWKTHSKLGSIEYANKDFMGLICQKSNMVFLSMAKYNGGFIAIDTKGTYDNPDDDTVHHWLRLTDQDNNEPSFTYYTFMLEDNRGCVWMGTSTGVFEITNPASATDPTMKVRRIKVPRNDGTNYADYLLESEMILWMALDPAGRKWIATENSGIYLVSETGDKIIEHYDTSNSPLPSNCVTSIECDKHDNTVYVGTTSGLYSFKGSASPGSEDYASIYAYPNPVRPEYSGIVTITGLMDNSVVKITDAQGSVVYETRSEGGMATWDVCNSSGDRVKSGVYYAYASQYNGNTSTGAVTKILVIN